MHGGNLEAHRSAVAVVERLVNPTLITSLLFAITWVFGESVDRGTILLATLTFSLIVWIFPLAGVYRSRRTRPLGERVPRIVVGWCIVVGALALVGFATKTTEGFSRRILLTWVVTAHVGLLVTDVAIGHALRVVRARGRNSRMAVIAGLGETGALLADRIRSSPEWGIRIAGFFDDGHAPGSSALGASILGGLSDLCAYVKSKEITHVYLALPISESERTTLLLDELRDTTASVYLVPFTSSPLTLNFSMQNMGGVPVFAVNETPFADEACLAIKRASDIIMAALCLAASAPFLLLIAAGIKLSSPGPVFFKQRRSGLNGREFVVYKFRTMTVMDDGTEIAQAERNDPRCTRFGALLRRSSLDELPQLVNVLQGTMSMVGPRPHAVAHNEQYRKLIRGYVMRGKIKPGITGWAQIHGLRGATRTLDKMERRVEFDLHYMSNWSLGLDLKILAKTPFTLFFNKSAY